MNTPVLIFLVEDEESIQMVLEEGLTEGGYGVVVARSGEEAVTLLDEKGAEFRALITDVNLSGTLTGWDVAKHAREINDVLPVVYMTGASAHEWSAKGVPNSVLLTKPFAVAQVVTAISQLVNAAAALLAKE